MKTGEHLFNKSPGKSKQKRDSKNESGLTLVELLVAAAIFSVISLTVFNVIDSFLRVQTSVTVRAQATSDGMLIFNQVALDIRNAQIPASGNTVTSLYTNGIPTNQLQITTVDLNGTPIVVCMVVLTSGTTITPAPCSATTQSSAVACPCTLTGYIVGATGNTIRYIVDNLQSANIFTITTDPYVTYPTPETVTINASFAPRTNQPSVTILNTIEMRNVALANS